MKSVLLRWMILRHLPNASEESAAVQVVDGLGTRLKSTAEAKDNAADDDGPASSDIVTGRTSECSTDEGARCEQRDDQPTEKRHYSAIEPLDNSYVSVSLGWLKVELKDPLAITSAMTPKSSAHR